MEIERKVYNGFAYTSNEHEKYEMNVSICNELKEKYKVKRLSSDEKLTDEILNEYDIVYSVEYTSRHDYATVHKAPNGLTRDELLCLVSNGYLPFGGSGELGVFTIYND